MKKLLTIILTFAFLVSLSGCTFRALNKVYEEQTGESGPLPEGDIVTHHSYRLDEITVTLSDGTTTRRKYPSTQIKNPTPDPDPYLTVASGCIYYENDEQVGEEVYTLDEWGSITSVTPDWEGGDVQSFSFTYDEQGRILTEFACLNGEFNYTATYTYDSHGNILVKEIETADLERLEYTYDSANRLTEVRGYLNDQLVSRTVSEYADNNRPNAVTVYDGDDNITFYSKHAHDDSYETVLEYQGDGTLLRRLERTYSHADKLVREIIYNAEDELESTTIWNYLRSSYSYIEEE